MAPLIKNMMRIGLAITIAILFIAFSFGFPLPKTWIQSTLDSYRIESDACKFKLALNAQPFEVQCSKVKKSDETLATCEYLSLGFTLWDLFKPAPSRITIDGVHLNLGDTQNEPSRNFDSGIIRSAIEVVLASSLNVVEFKNAKVALFNDDRLIHLNKAKISLDRQNKTPTFKLRLKKQGAREEKVKIDYDLEKNEAAVLFDGVDLDSWFQALGLEQKVKLGSPVTGEAQIILGQDWLSTKILGRLSTTQNGNLFLSDLYPTGLICQNIQCSVDGRLGHLVGSIDVATVHPKAHFQFEVISDQGVLARKITIDGQVHRLPHKLFTTYWPEKLGTDTRSWVIRNLSVGEVPLATIHLEFERQGEEWALGDMNGTMKISNMTVDYMDGLPKVQSVDGEAEFNKQHFVIDAKSGKLDDLVVEGGKLDFYNLDKKSGLASIELKIHGPLQQALQVADAGNLKYPTSLGVNPADVKGEALINLGLRFPLQENITSKDIQVNILSTIQQLHFSKPLSEPIKILDIRNGKGKLSLDNNQMIIESDAVAWDIPVQLKWVEKFNRKPKIQREMSLSGNLSEKQRAKLSIPEIPGISKDYACELIHTTQLDGKERLAINLDLTPSIVDAGTFFRKNENDPASLKLIIEDIRKGLAQDVGVAYEDRLGNILATLVMDPNFVPKELKNVQVNYNGNQLTGSWLRNESGWTLFVDARLLDVRPYLAQLRDTRNETEWFGDISLKAETLKVGEHKHLKKVKGTFSRRGSIWHSVELTAEPKTLISLSTKSTGRDFRLKTEATPTILAIMMDGDKIMSGKTTLTLTQSALEIDPWVGHLHMSQAGVKDMPLLAKVLSIISPVAVMEMLSGKGLVFGNIDADVSIKDKRIHLSHAEATSLALGITFSGHIDMDKETIAMHGNVIPAYAVNSLIGKIPLVGQAIAGGKGQGLVSAGFTIAGTFEHSVTRVNPLSMLAPGFMRKIFELKPQDPTQSSQPNHP
ncbi:MAG: hypothetical protein BGO28_07130 [Alphaproteobacteria bacterium 43-37]|nr:MAG: hypothetical protein BGO28_07130 [Alphaproteobacteria bacterium 43-37]